MPAELDSLIERLQGYRAAIADEDADTLTSLLREGKEMKDLADAQR